MKADAPTFTVLAASDLYLFLTHKKREEVLGRGLFEVYPGSHADPSEQNSVYSSFMRVIDTGKPDELPIFKYEIVIDGVGSKETHYWTNLNEPILDVEGNTAFIINTTTNITERILLEEAVEESRKRERLLNSNLIEANEKLLTVNTRLLNNEQILQLAINSANLGIWYIDAHTRAFVPSPRLKELFGYHPDEEMPYDAAVNQIVEEYRERVSAAIEAAITQGKLYDLQYPIIGYHDSKIRWVRATGQLYKDDTGQAGYFSGTALDITEQKEDELRKNDFISMVSHELKTPLTSMKGYLQILQSKAQKSDDVSSTKMLGKASTQIDKMTTLINGFLNVSRLESGKIHINKKVFDMALLIKEVEEESLTTILSHTVVFAPVVETLVSGDRDKIGQVINNFINNAVKYSPANTTINVTCVTTNGKALVSVKDEGIGIAPKDIDRLFERYYRVDNDNMTSIAGFGIGLYICSEIIERHGGNIGVESALGEGSTFWFTLPVNE
jgi:PAS domain S-box-containing protein